MNVPHVIAARCSYCSRGLPVWRVHRLAGNAQTICDTCLEWHMRAIEFLAGHAEPACQSCGAQWAVLRDARPAEATVRMYVVPKDGILQMLCSACVKPYTEKRRDLYRGTAFGHAALRC